MLYLEKFILSLGNLALDQRKKLSVSQILISQIFATVKRIFQSLEQFYLVISNFSQNFQNSLQFLSQISLFSTRSGTIAAIMQARMSKDSLFEFFLSNVLILVCIGDKRIGFCPGLL